MLWTTSSVKPSTEMKSQIGRHLPLMSTKSPWSLLEEGPDRLQKGEVPPGARVGKHVGEVVLLVLVRVDVDGTTLVVLLVDVCVDVTIVVVLLVDFGVDVTIVVVLLVDVLADVVRYRHNPLPAHVLPSGQPL
jgi:hypothetical protein